MKNSKIPLKTFDPNKPQTYETNEGQYGLLIYSASLICLKNYRSNYIPKWRE
jgi:hypothetical protein